MFKFRRSVLKDFEGLYRNIVDNISIGIALIDPDMHILALNPQMQKWFPKIDVSKKPICYTAFNNPPRAETCSYCPTCKTLQDGEVHETITDTPLGDEVRHYRIISSPIKDKRGNIIAAIEMVDDVTERKKIEEALYYRIEVEKIIDTISTNFITLEPDKINEGIVNALETMGNLTGVDRGCVYILSHDQARFEVVCQWYAKGIDSQVRMFRPMSLHAFPWFLEQINNIETVHIPNVDTLPLEANTEKLELQSQAAKSVIFVPMAYAGNLVGMLRFDSLRNEQHWSNEDIRMLKLIGEIFVNALQRKRVEEAIRTAYQMNSAILENAPFGIYVVDHDGTIEYVNQAMVRISGDNYDQFKSMNIFELPTYKQLDIDKKIRSALRGNYFRLEAVEYTSHFAKKTTVRNFTGIPLEKEGMRKVLIFVEDITERKRAEDELRKAYQEVQETQEKLIQSEKMAALGRFSSGVAHEVRNPLAIILGGVEFLEEQFSPKDMTMDVKITIEKIKESTLRADHILQSLLKFARPSELIIEKTNPSDLITETLSLLTYRAPLINIKIETEFCPELMYVDVDKNQMQQVIFNILLNAIEAMSQGGSITIKTYTTRQPMFSFEKPACVIEISDNGVGISKKNLSRIFEPFFTTRRDKKGTGLGLPISRKIIDNHNGNMLVESEGTGTSVKLVLPLSPINVSD